MSQPDESVRATLQPTSEAPRSIQPVLVNRRAGWIFWLQWVLANTLGWAVGGALYSLLFTPCVFILTFFALFVMGSLFGSTIATPLGLMQRRVLERYIRPIGSWGLASLAGGGLGGALSTFIFLISLQSLGRLFSNNNTATVNYVLLAVCGAVTGNMLGRRQHTELPESIRREVHWPLINTLGWSAGCLTSGLLSGGQFWPAGLGALFANIFSSGIAQMTVLAASAGLVGGAITGLPLARAIRRSERG